MGKILVLAEKPSVARDIARVLGVKTKKDGYIEGERYLVSWAIGHLVALCDPEEYAPEYKKWSMATLPILPEEMKLLPVKKTAQQLKMIIKLMNSKEVDSIICATDAGREGELIFRYIYMYAHCKKDVQRLWISSMTDQAISEGFRKLRDGAEYDRLFASARCRSEADWLVGINASRAYTLQYNALLSIGRVQTPTLSMIVKRQQEIDAFVPEEYYEVTADFGTHSGLWFLKEESKSRIAKKETADAIVKKVQKQTGSIKSIRREEKKQPPPLLYDLTELQRDCNRRFGFSAQKTLSLVQSLYEVRKLVTYPRTDSNYLSNDMAPKLPGILKRFQNIAPYQPYVGYILNLPALPLGSRVIDNKKVTDHHAIIPTDVTVRTEGLSPEEAKVYHLIVLRFLCVFLPHYEYAVTKVVTEVLEETFLSKGTEILHEGWMRLYRKLLPDTKKKKEKEVMLPSLSIGDAAVVQQAKALKKKTTPPKPYTEATLLSAMENAGRLLEEESLREMMKDSGLGTPATRAAIIERLIAVGYLCRKNKSLLPTEKGVSLIAAVPEALRSPEMTGKWEKGLVAIERGSMDETRFMESIRRFVRFLVEEGKKKNESVHFAEEKAAPKKTHSLGVCPRCQTGRVLENTKAFYCSEWKAGCKFTMWKSALEQYGAQLTPAIVKKLLAGKPAEGLAVTLPQTGEKCLAELWLMEDKSGMVELRKVARRKEEKA